MKKLLVYGELANKSSTRTSPLYFSEQAGNEDWIDTNSGAKCANIRWKENTVKDKQDGR